MIVWEDATVKTVTGIVSASILLFLCNNVFAQWADYNNNCSSWTFNVAGKVLDRTGDDNGLALISNSLTNAPLFRSNDATDLDVGAGLEASLKHKGQMGLSFELEVDTAEWENANSFFGPNLQSPFLPGLSPDSIFYEYDSSFFSIEFNARRKTLPGLTLLCGPRFVNLRERVVTTSFLTIPTPPVGTFDLTIRNDVTTKNRMIGFQVGGEYDVQMTRDIHIHSFLKAGAYSNATSFTNKTDTTLAISPQSEQRRSVGSFLGEVGVRGHMDIIPSVLSVFVGYEANWLDGVALAPVQLLNPNAPINTATTPFFHGATFGVQARY